MVRIIEKIRREYNSVVTGLRNICRYIPVIYIHRWWDYYYMLEVMDKMLEDREQNWVVNTHYLGDAFTLGRIKVLRRMYAQYKRDGWEDEPKLIRRYLRNFARTVTRLWD